MQVFIVLSLCCLSFAPSIHSREYEKNQVFKNFTLDDIPKSHVYKWDLLVDEAGDTFLVDTNPLIDDGTHALFEPETEVEYWLYTRTNNWYKEKLFPDKTESVEYSSLKRNTKTVVIIHGKGGSGDDEMNKAIREGILINHDWNIISLDWSKGSSNWFYYKCQERIDGVARVLARFIDVLVRKKFISMADIVLVGFGLGGHTAGLTAKKVEMGRIPYIVALDPAGPKFNYDVPSTRLDKLDADYVEVIHTNGGTSTGHLGMLEPIGTADFYVAWGSAQPGCGTWEDLTGDCSHERAGKYFAESVLGGHRFLASKCRKYEEMTKNVCVNVGYGYMGDITQPKESGVYYLPINNAAPFSQSRDTE